MKKIRTYIGICDFMTQDQVFEMLDVFRHYTHTNLQLMVGTMTSFKVLNNHETKWATIFPKPEALPYIFSAVGDDVVNCIHYADYENKPGLSETLEKVIAHCGKLLDAIQLDMVWPDAKELEVVKKAHPNLSFILQVSKRSMNECFDNPIQVANKIRDEYGNGLISHVLLDCSIGKGVPINVPHIEGYIEAIKSRASEIDIAVAGALGPDSVHKVAELIAKWRVSTDAQSKLRHSGKAEDPIDWDLAKKHLHNTVGYYL